MNLTEQFQTRHGARWAAIAQGPELTDALLTVNQSIFDEIRKLSPEATASPVGNIILARLQGQLLHEQSLLELAAIQPDNDNDLPDATYSDPTDEEQQADQQDSGSGGSVFFEHQGEQLLEKPKPKRKRRKTK